MVENNHSESKEKKYKSPIRKLVPFFESSRDKWKAKCQEAKYQLKLVRNRIRYMEKRDDDLKRKIKALKKELKNTKNREQQLIEQVEQLKKKQ